MRSLENYHTPTETGEEYARVAHSAIEKYNVRASTVLPKDPYEKGTYNWKLFDEAYRAEMKRLR